MKGRQGKSSPGDCPFFIGAGLRGIRRDWIPGDSEPGRIVTPRGSKLSHFRDAVRVLFRVAWRPSAGQRRKIAGGAPVIVDILMDRGLEPPEAFFSEEDL